MATGDLTLTWKRRARLNANMRDLSDIPLGENGEAYEIDILKGDTPVRTLTSNVHSVLYSVANQTTDFGAAQALAGFNAYQTGKFGRGYVGNFPIYKLLPGLVLVLRPDIMLPTVANGGNVTNWFDLSGSKSHASESTNPPTLIYSAQNGLPIVRFNGTTQKLTGRVNVVSGTQGRTVYLVLKPAANNTVLPIIALSSGTTAGAIQDYTITPEFSLRLSGASRFWLSGGVNRFDTTAFHTLAMRTPTEGLASTTDAFYDGAALTVSTTTDGQINNLATAYTLGFWSNGGSFLQMDLGDVYVYNQWHSDVQVALMQTYLKNRWSTP